MLGRTVIITDHAFDSARKRLNMTRSAFGRWVMCTKDKWKEEDASYFQNKGLRVYDDLSKRFFRCPWDTEKGLCLIFHKEMDVMVSLLWYHDDPEDTIAKLKEENGKLAASKNKASQRADSSAEKIKKLESEIENLKHNLKVQHQALDAAKFEIRRMKLSDREEEHNAWARGGWHNSPPDKEGNQ